MSSHNIYIKEKVDKFDKDILTYGKSINEKAIWLFLATISIISIEDYFLKFIAYILIIVIFFYYHATIKSSKDSFSDSYKKLSDEIKEIISDETIQKSLLYDLCLIKEKQNSKNLFNYEFIVFSSSILFYVVSILRFFQLSME